MDNKKLPLILKLEKARNEFRFQVNSISCKYDMPGYLIDLVIESILAEEKQQRLSLMAEQTTIGEEVIEDGEDTDLS